ncbi:hypothetical protein K445DRAFT_320100 [Daldinia sp. EC12]|nr:hypothetical protein K445DRAFT_320100 [Daldinia sp. EC12]
MDYHSSVFSYLYCIHYLGIYFTYCPAWRQILKETSQLKPPYMRIVERLSRAPLVKQRVLHLT